MLCLPMKLSILISSFTLFNSVCFSQSTIANRKEFPFSDTTLSTILLADTSTISNLVAVENNKNTIIYINKDSIETLVNKKLIESAYNKNDYTNILLELGRLKDGEIKDLTALHSSAMKNIISQQIMSGHVKIYDKKNMTYITTVHHRIERVISTGYRTFYFSNADQRYLYRFAQWHGIIPNELMPDIE